MSGLVPGNLTNPLGPGMPMPGETGPGMPPPRAPGANGTPGGGGGAPPGLGPQMPTGLDGAMQALQKGHGQARAAFEQTSKAVAQMDHVRKGLEKLSDRGDMVTPEDVIGEASKLVAHGIDPMALATILADMPQEGGGEALGGWVTAHAVSAAQAEQQLMQARAVAQHELGVSAVHMLTAHDVHRAVTGSGPQPEASADGGNSLGASGAPPPPQPMGGSLGLGQASAPPAVGGPAQ
jgi:hypothetical protein